MLGRTTDSCRLEHLLNCKLGKVHVEAERVDATEQTDQKTIWQSNGALEMLFFALVRVEAGTRQLLAADDSAIVKIKDFVAENIEPLAVAQSEGDPEAVLPEDKVDELVQLQAPLFTMIAGLSGDIRTANLMAAIDLEASVNQFLYLHLAEQVVDAIDRLSIQAKLEIAHSTLGQGPFKATSAYEGVTSLFSWRDAFAHGKLPGVSTKKSLGDIHLRRIDDMPLANPQSELRQMMQLISGYIRAQQHLRSLAQHKPIFSTLAHFSNIEMLLAQIRDIRQTSFEYYYLSATERRQLLGTCTSRSPRADGSGARERWVTG
jgi:hypothetical protein